MTTQLLDTEIKFNRDSKDYDILVCGVVCATARNYGLAEEKRTRLLAERRNEGLYATAGELDPDDGPPPPSWDDPVLIAGHSSGDLDLPAIGRRLARLDRGGLTAYLASTPRRFWPMLARALALVIEPNAADHAETEAGMIWIWSGLVTWHQAGPSR